MTLTIELAPDTEARLRAEARREGVETNEGDLSSFLQLGKTSYIP
jgi:hypothetical protein